MKLRELHRTESYCYYPSGVSEYQRAEIYSYSGVEVIVKDILDRDAVEKNGNQVLVEFPDGHLDIVHHTGLVATWKAHEARVIKQEKERDRAHEEKINLIAARQKEADDLASIIREMGFDLPKSGSPNFEMADDDYYSTHMESFRFTPDQMREIFLPHENRENIVIENRALTSKNETLQGRVDDLLSERDALLNELDELRRSQL